MRIPIARPSLPPFDKYRELIEDIFRRRYVSNFAKYSSLLEERASETLGENLLAVASCDTGLMLAWRALGVSSGEVIVPSFTFASTVNSIVWNGLRPVFADIDPRSLCIDPTGVQSLISPETVAIVGVHCFGEPVPEELDQIAVHHGFKLVFDAAHAIGTTVHGQSLAGRGDVSVFSLSGTKTITAGEGGLAAIRDADVRKRFAELRNYGFLGDYDAKAAGINGKMSEMNAALGYLSFQMVDELIERRQEIAIRYRRNLAQFAQLHLPAMPPPGDTKSFKDFAIVFPDGRSREAAELSLSRNGIETKRYFLPVHLMSAYREMPMRGPLPVTEEMYDRALCVPIFFDLEDVQIDEISEIISVAIS